MKFSEYAIAMVVTLLFIFGIFNLELVQTLIVDSGYTLSEVLIACIVSDISILTLFFGLTYRG